LKGAAVKLVDIWKSFRGTPALRGVNLEARQGEITTILGPSGCGKTTTLKVIAGLESPDRGKVLFDDEDVTGIPVENRDIGMVFQDLALFPHMTVWSNIAFGLEARRLPAEEVRRRVKWALELVNLDPQVYANRRVTELSGGQQQRVALARALVLEPRVLLLDEPLSHMDYLLRRSLLRELKKLQRRVGVTTIYVTHDQTEAMILSDWLVVMRNGAVVQSGTPMEVYENPRDSFVATFFGDGNLADAGFFGVDGAASSKALLRLEDVEVNPDPRRVDVVREGRIVEAFFQGPLTRLEIDVDGVILAAYARAGNGWRPRSGERVRVGWRLSDVRVLPG